MYDLGDRLLMVATDRISTYDVVHPNPIPDKGKVLTGLSVFWFERMQQICPNHLVSFTDVPDEVRGRALLVERLDMIPIECVARGYITGSGWKDHPGSRPRLHHRLGLEGLPGDRLRLRDRAARGSPGIRKAPGADLHAGDQGGDRRPRREHRLRPRCRDPRRPRTARGAPPSHARDLLIRGRARP